MTICLFIVFYIRGTDGFKKNKMKLFFLDLMRY